MDALNHVLLAGSEELDSLRLGTLIGGQACFSDRPEGQASFCEPRPRVHENSA
jgi:hypothetical protein